MRQLRLQLRQCGFEFFDGKDGKRLVGRLGAFKKSLDQLDFANELAFLHAFCIEVLLELWRNAIGLKGRVTADTGRKVLQPVALWLHGEENRTRATANELTPVIEPSLKSVGWPHGPKKRAAGSSTQFAEKVGSRSPQDCGKYTKYR